MADKTAPPAGVEVVMITASATMVVNTGQYEKAEFSHFMQATVAPGADHRAALAWLMHETKRAVAVAAGPTIERRQKNINSVWESLPAEVRADVLVRAGIDPAAEV